MAERMYAATLYWKFNTGIVALYVILIGPMVFTRFRKLAVTGTAWLLIMLVGLRVSSLTPVKPFCIFYRELRVGMSVEEVHARLQGTFVGSGYRMPSLARDPSDSGLYYCILNSSDGRYNAEAIIFWFKNGFLSKTMYASD